MPNEQDLLARVEALEARVAELEAQADGIWRMGRDTYRPTCLESFNQLEQAFGPKLKPYQHVPPFVDLKTGTVHTEDDGA